MEERKIKLPFGTKLGYGVGDIGGNLFFTVSSFWLMNYLTDRVGLAAGLAGVAVLIGRVFDAVTDPAMGYISDRTKSRWGRRRPFIFAGAFLMLIAMVLMYTNPQIEKQVPKFIWAAGMYSLLSLAYTIFSIPYSSLTPELTSDYDERTSLSSFRMFCAVIGTFIGAGAALSIVGAFSNPNTGYSVMGGVFGGIMCVTALITFFSVREPDIPRQKPDKKLFRSYLSTFTNRSFVLILLPWVFTSLAVAILSGTLIYYFRGVYGAPDGTTNLALLTLLGSAMIFIPIWAQIAKRIEKKYCLLIGVMVLTAAVILFFFIGRQSISIAFVLMAISGFGLATYYVLPWSIVPDAIEYDYTVSRVRREGVYYGIWNFLMKVGQGLGALLMGWILSIFKYAPEAAEQTVQARLGIRLLFGPIAAVFFIIAGIIVTFYPITKERYAEILAKSKEIETEEAGG